MGKEYAEWVLGDLLAERAKNAPDAVAIIHEDVKTTYGELNKMADDMAAALIDMGVQKGDKLGIWFQNLPEWVVAWFGISKAGAVVIPMDYWYKPSEAEYILNHSGAVGIVTANTFGKTNFLDMLDEIRPNLTSLKHIIVVNNNPDYEPNLEKGEVTLPALLEKGAGLGGKAEMVPDDVAFILYTSGTTGQPKGAQLTHANVIRNAWDAADIMELSAADKFLVPVPFSHCFGNVLSITMACCAGAGICPMDVFDPRAALELIQKHQLTVAHGVPTMFIRELEILETEKFDTSSLRTGIMAGAPCPIDTMEGVINIMGFNVCIGYGLTEASPLITMTQMNDDIKHRVETVGKAIPDVEVKIVDDDHNEVPMGEMGELACKGYNVMKGYFKMPEQTAEAIDDDGWLYSGDLATVDEEGYYKIVGRKKDMVIVGGFNVYPVEIENFLMEHEKIVNATIVGVSDHDLGEVVAAVIEAEEGITGQDIVDYCYGTINKFAVPRFVFIGDEIPVSGRGKVQKFILRKQLDDRIKEEGIEKIVPTKVKERS